MTCTLNRHVCRWLLLALFVPALLLVPASVRAQEDEEEAPAAPARPAARAARPAGQPGAAAEVPKPEEPAVLTIIESNPKTPAEIVRAAEILVNLGRPPLAKSLLKRLIGAKLDGKAQAALITKFGSPTFMRMAENPDLAPEGQQLADMVLAGASAYRQDPARLAAWARQLSAANADARVDAMIELGQSHSAAVAPLVQILADPARANEHSAARKMLVRLGSDATSPLLGVLETKDVPLKIEVIHVLTQLRPRSAIHQLLAPAVAPSSPAELKQAAADALLAIAGAHTSIAEAKALLEREVRSLLERSLRDVSFDEAPVTVWHWDAAQKASVPTEYRAIDADAAIAGRLGHDLNELDKSNIGYRRLYLTGLLGAAKYRHGLARPLPSGEGTEHAVAATFGVPALDDLLTYAMHTGHIPAATAAAEILGDTADAGILVSAAGRNSPLADATRHSDRRLRFAAVGAIIKLNPQQSFAGATGVSEALGYFAGTYGARRALVAHPRGEKGQWIAGLLGAQGYEVDLATNGRKAFELATRSPDYELILVHMAIDHPEVDSLLMQLRKDSRTARLPIGVIEIVDDIERARRLARGFQSVLAIAEPQDEAAARSQVEWLLTATARNNVSREERRVQALTALEWLAVLADDSTGIYDLRRQVPAVQRALYVPEMSAKVAIVLGKLGTAAGQRSLAELASRPTQPLALRQAAALAFKGSVTRHGILLTSSEILSQYTLYNASERLDSDTQKVLASILDTLERKDDDAEETASQQP